MRHFYRFLALASATALAAPLMAQDIVYEPINPAFGGNPFNADYLLATATPQRPDRPSSPSSEPLTEAQQFARQIQSRLLSALSSSIVTAITGAEPGTSGEFTVGDQTIRFERTLSEIRLTIVDNVTGEVTEIVVPVLSLNSGASGSADPTAGTLASSSLAGSGQLPSAGGSLSGGPLTGAPLTPGSLSDGLGLEGIN